MPTVFAEPSTAAAGHAVADGSAENVIEVTLTGKLAAADYEAFVPRIEPLLQQHDKVRMVVILDDFHGWSVGALWEDVKFDLKHFADIDRLAIVGDATWEKGMSVFCKPFTTAKVQYFDLSKVDAARAWVREN
ncbi:STAS/SEC14 domain-containing protein [Alienimonas chondri]|uniref:STAS/SEC14 domain-containing protein n=1 Tax=Alienimonas chondri TaxID=2681879 RepID=A0ABX1VEQ0_9PLAN|nr:STAS/SEC14 domain-containing protein [Alienimonas chondri]NNJ25985.1 hypothetical protein [Alienimonas chondri]